MSEAQEQAALISWADWAKFNGAEKIGDYLFAVPNGGSRHPAEAANLKRQGVRAGVPDLFVCRQSNGKGGLFIEMKTAKGKVAPTQEKWLERLKRANYEVAVCRGWLEAKRVIEEYLG